MKLSKIPYQAIPPSIQLGYVKLIECPYIQK